MYEAQRVPEIEGNPIDSLKTLIEEHDINQSDLPEIGTQALAYYDHPVFGAYPAVTRNEYGKGWLIYEGTYLADALQEKVVAAALAEARIEPAAAGLPAGVKVKQAVLADGAAVRAYLNFSGARKEFVYRGPSGSELLTGRTIAPSTKVVLGPWDLAIIREYQKGDTYSMCPLSFLLPGRPVLLDRSAGFP